MYDSIVVGLGGMGSAAAAHLAQRGRRVVGFEQFAAVHDRGSSHGKTRIIRQAYYEDPAYVPLLLRAYELWHELEQRVGQTLYVRTGGLMVGLPSSAIVAGSERSAREHDLGYEVLDANDIKRRFPTMRPRPEEVGVFEVPAGMLFPERCVRAHLDWAASAGADLRFNSPVIEWGVSRGAVFVRTAAGDLIEADSIVLCQGAWLRHASGAYALPVRAERNVMHWFEPHAAHAAELQALPVYIVDRAGNPPLYGFPYIPGEGIKAAFHHSGVYTTPEELQRIVDPIEIETVRIALHEWLPDASGPHVASAVCMYEMTPDEHFLVGVQPDAPNVIIAGGFSGHGFKFCSVMGEIIADLAMQGKSKHPIGLFDPWRFGK
ncbi:MAG: N-methyl-L-tryptophan oxidase [Candidatus Eremiobacteraeota bacterium]|nr:N-methyl-L-tryptophan oxidase [Candidatus Eremiobacteraeota bacterium]